VRLARRSFLKGLSGAALALPTLEAMLDGNGVAYADGSAVPKRYALVFAGTSLGMGYNDPSKPGFYRNEPRDMFVPDTVGPGYDLKLALQPLGDFGVQGVTSVVSGLRIPYAESSGQAIPTAGVPNVFHGPQYRPLLTGMRHTGPARPSSDQVAAAALGSTVFPSLYYRANPVTYWIDNVENTETLSINPDGSYRGFIASPNVAYTQMLEKIVLTDAMQAAERQRLFRERKSVLDLVQGTAPRLMSRLGTADRLRLQRHFDELRALELKLQAPEALCPAPMVPVDPPIGGATVTASADGKENVYTTAWDTKGWSQENLRAELLADLIALAFRCDLSRSAVLDLGGGTMSVYHLVGARVDVHGCSHFSDGTTDSGSTLLMSRVMQAYYVKYYAYLVDKLRDLMNDCTVVYLCEGGVGRSMEAPDPMEQPKAHSTENMVALVAGTGGGLKGGEHVVAPATASHPANVLVSALKSVGVASDTLGEVSGVVPGLFA
jgi:hypothetical protein